MIRLPRHISMVIAGMVCMISCAPSAPSDALFEDALPQIFPDYVDVTIPSNIAPLNFSISDASEVWVEARGADGTTVVATGEYADFPLRRWREVLENNVGDSVVVSSYAKKGGQWLRYRDFTIHVSANKLDAWGLVYRKVAPGYETYSTMGIYQREISSFNEMPIIENTMLSNSCINCHTSNATKPEQFTMHVRGVAGGTLMSVDGRQTWLDTKTDSTISACVYPYWHPGGRYCAYSTNITKQGFLEHSRKPIEVYDETSDIVIFDTFTNSLFSTPLLKSDKWSENTPVFSPNGKWLYFITAQNMESLKRYTDVKYNLCRIGFDAATGTFGNQVDTLFNASAIGKSVTWPRPSYDGKYLLFSLIDYGYFSIWHPESEQWIFDLSAGVASPISENEKYRAGSFHNWSVDSRWIVFTSRVADGLYTQLFLASVKDDGTVGKPFLLPQREPHTYYSETIYSFNTPDFTLSKVNVDVHDYAIEAKKSKLKVGYKGKMGD